MADYATAKRVLIVNPHGAVGVRLIEACLSAGCWVRGAGVVPLEGTVPDEFQHGTLENTANCQRAVAGIEHVFAFAEPPQPSAVALAGCVRDCIDILRAAQLARVKSFAFVTAAERWDGRYDPQREFLRHLAKLYMRDFGLQAHCLDPDSIIKAFTATAA